MSIARFVLIVAVVLIAGCAADTAGPASEGSGGQASTTTPAAAGTASSAAMPSPVSAGLPVAGSALLRTGERGDVLLRLAVHGLRRVPGATVLDWSVTPVSAPGTTAGEKIVERLNLAEDQAYHAMAVYLVDSAARRVYRPLVDRIGQNANCLCTPFSLAANDLVLGETRLLQVAFPPLPAGRTGIDVQLPGVPVVPGVPLTAAGQVPTGSGAADLGAAGSLPVVARTAVFRYPARDPFGPPRQAVSIAVNAVVASAGQTSLVWTVTAYSDGDGVGLSTGRPVNDNALASIMVAYKSTIASGPGLVPAGSGPEAKVLRARFAVVSAKKDRPTTGTARHRWLECLCTDLQSFAAASATRGRSVTMVTTMPALPRGTAAVDVVFPAGGVAPLRGVRVSTAPAAALGPPVAAPAGTWTFDPADRPGGWTVAEWPTPVPDPASVARFKALVDPLVEIRTDQVSTTRERPRDVVVSLDSTVSFRPDSALLTPVARKVIAGIARDINTRAVAGSRVLVEGHVAGTDRGSVAVQQRLSDARARAVYGALRALVRRTFGFQVVGRGAAEPVAPNDSEPNRRLNRRVEVTYRR